MATEVRRRRIWEISVLQKANSRSEKKFPVAICSATERSEARVKHEVSS